MNRLVIDVSYHQGTIDWEKVKAAGVEGAIIRCGYGMDMESRMTSSGREMRTSVQGLEFRSGHIFILTQTAQKRRRVRHSTHFGS